LEQQYVSKREVQQKEIDELKQELEKKNEELHKLNSALVDLKRANEELQVEYIRTLQIFIFKHYPYTLSL